MLPTCSSPRCCRFAALHRLDHLQGVPPVLRKGPALVRRFQKIDVNEPAVPDTIEILKGLKPYFEDYHKVRYTSDAIKTAVELSRATSMTASCRTRPST
jgi:hypothetical protein